MDVGQIWARPAGVPPGDAADVQSGRVKEPGVGCVWRLAGRAPEGLPVVLRTHRAAAVTEPKKISKITVWPDYFVDDRDCSSFAQFCCFQNITTVSCYHLHA